MEPSGQKEAHKKHKELRPLEDCNLFSLVDVNVVLGKDHQSSDFGRLSS